MRRRLPITAALLALALTACDPSTVDTALDDTADPAGASCPVGTPDCVDAAPPADGGDPDAIDEGAILREAEALLGTARADLPADVRIGRIGDEHLPLTEDYVVGRMTVELDAAETVVAVIVELTEGPHTLRA